MHGTHKKTYLAVLLALSPLVAQAGNDKDTQNIERITVTGSRIAESLDEVPASITLIDQQTIKENLQVSSEPVSYTHLTLPTTPYV